MEINLLHSNAFPRSDSTRGEPNCTFFRSSPEQISFRGQFPLSPNRTTRSASFYSSGASNKPYASPTAVQTLDLSSVKHTSNDYAYDLSMKKPRSATILERTYDEYGGVVVDHDKLPSSDAVFASMLRFSLSQWKIKGKKGVWLKLPLDRADLVPIAAKEGFEYHHAEPGYVMMTLWLPEGTSKLPGNASHQVGIGGFVVNRNNEILVVQEKFCASSFSGLWKIPTGYILEAEEIYAGAVREVKEETGIDTEFEEVVAFRHAQNLAFDKSDLFFVCMLRPLSSEIKLDDHEIVAAKWMPLDEFVEQKMIQEDLMFKKIVEICVARMGKKYCGLATEKLHSKFDGRVSCLYYNLSEPDFESCVPS